MKTERLYSLELLRIFAMLLIVCHHFSVHGAIHAAWVNELIKNHYLKFFWVEFLASGGKVGVNLFVMITGYFLIHKIAKVSSLIKLYLTTVSYTLIIYLIFVFFGKTSFTLNSLIDNIFPIATGRYWFITAYAVLILISPFLSIGLNSIFNSFFELRNSPKLGASLPIINSRSSLSLVKTIKDSIFHFLCYIFSLRWFVKYDSDLENSPGFKRGVALLFVLVILFSFFPSLVLFGQWPSFYVNDLIWFIVLFCTASTISFFNFRFSSKTFAIFSLCFFLLYFWVNSLNLVVLLSIATDVNILYPFSQNNLLIYILSVSIFLYFKDLKCHFNFWVKKIINIIAPSTLGIYLIHDNEYIRPFLWNVIFNTKKHFFYDSFFLWSIYSIFLVFLTCVVVDRLLNIIEKPIFSIINHKFSKLDSIVINLFKSNKNQ